MDDSALRCSFGLGYAQQRQGVGLLLSRYAYAACNPGAQFLYHGYPCHGDMMGYVKHPRTVIYSQSLSISIYLSIYIIYIGDWALGGVSCTACYFLPRPLWLYRNPLSTFIFPKLQDRPHTPTLRFGHEKHKVTPKR